MKKKISYKLNLKLFLLDSINRSISFIKQISLKLICFSLNNKIYSNIVIISLYQSLCRSTH